jgi:hypothetical protein
MSFLPEIIYGNFWGLAGYSNFGNSYLAGIKNIGTTNVRIVNVYVRNIISNYQEHSNITNFAFTIPTSEFVYPNNEIKDETPNASDNFNIPYPPYYKYKPGNENYENFGLAKNKYNFRIYQSFTLYPNATVDFKIQFTPYERKVEFYRAELVVLWKELGDDKIYKINFSLKGNLLYETKEIDSKEFPSEIMTVSGIPFGSLISIQ